MQDENGGAIAAIVAGQVSTPSSNASTNGPASTSSDAENRISTTAETPSLTSTVAVENSDVTGNPLSTTSSEAVGKNEVVIETGTLRGAKLFLMKNESDNQT